VCQKLSTLSQRNLRARRGTTAKPKSRARRHLGLGVVADQLALFARSAKCDAGTRRRSLPRIASNILVNRRMCMMIEIPALMLADVRRLLVCAQAAAAEAEARLLGRATERDALTSVAVVLNAALAGMAGSSQATPASVRELPFDLATEVLGRVSSLHLPALLQGPGYRPSDSRDRARDVESPRRPSHWWPRSR
jgi:hypothetical protein